MNTEMSSPWIELAVCWGWSLLHSVWMLALIALALACVLKFMVRASASSRYAVMVAALVLMAAVPLLAMHWTAPGSLASDLWAMGAASDAPAASLVAAPGSADAGPSASYATYAEPEAGPAVGRLDAYNTPQPIGDIARRLAALFEPALPWVAALWLAGVLLASLRLTCGGVWVWRTARRGGVSAPAGLIEACARVAAALRLPRAVRVVQSTWVEAPTLLGWVRPMILLPPSALLGLTPRQLEMVLAHELAHLARYDHVVNFFQVAVETLLFYHPAVWWLSRRIREERELCCDDCAMALFAGRHEYASALAFLETHRSGWTAPGLAATGSPLVLRVRRLLLAPERSVGSGRLVAGLLLLVGLTGLFGVITVQAANQVLVHPEARPAAVSGPVDAWVEVTFPDDGVGTVCVREPGTGSFFDWRETNPAAGKVLLPPDAEVALKVDAGKANDLAFLDALPPNALTGLLLGVFYSYRAGNEPPEQVYANVLQTEDRTRMPAYDDDMARVTAFEGLRELYLDHSFVGDAGVAELAALTSLEVLSLVDTEITDEALRTLSALPALRRLDLSDTAVTDEGLAYLAAMPALEDVTLDRTAITDAGVAELAALRTLRRLSLNFTAVSDVGVASLAALPALRELRTWHTGVSPEAQAEAGHATGPNEYGLATPKAGIILSEFTATIVHSMQYEYTHRHETGIANVLLSLGYDLYAVIDPGSENQGYLPQVLERLGLEGRTIDGSDPRQLAELDVVLSGHDPKMLDSVIAGLATAVKGGLGFVNTSVFGNRIPGNGPALSELVGIDAPGYSLQFEYVECPVLASHPILGGLQPGDTFVAKWLNGFGGKVRGTPLLGPPQDGNPDFCPLYVYDLGRGHVVNIQWQQISVTNGDIGPLAFYARCVNFAAGVPVDATW